MSVDIATVSTGPNTFNSCVYCGAYHRGICPRIEEIEYHPNGTTKRVKLRAAPTQPSPPDPASETLT